MNISASPAAISAIETVPIDHASLEIVLGFILAVDARQKAKTPLARCGSARLLFLQARGN